MLLVTYSPSFYMSTLITTLAVKRKFSWIIQPQYFGSALSPGCDTNCEFVRNFNRLSHQRVTLSVYRNSNHAVSRLLVKYCN